MAKKNITMAQVVDACQPFFQDCEDNMLWYKDVFCSSIDDIFKAEILLIGNHQNRMNDIVYMRAEVRRAIDILATEKLWNRSGFKSFQEIYDYVVYLLKDVKYVGILAYYDVAFRLTSIFTTCRPKEVYLHAGPLVAAEALLDRKITVRKLPVSEFNKKSIYLNAEYIEILLCDMKAFFTGAQKKPRKFKQKPNFGLRSNLLAFYISSVGIANVTTADLKLHSVYYK